jgi:hypothetical protein
MEQAKEWSVQRFRGVGAKHEVIEREKFIHMTELVETSGEVYEYVSIRSAWCLIVVSQNIPSVAGGFNGMDDWKWFADLLLPSHLLKCLV